MMIAINIAILLATLAFQGYLCIRLMRSHREWKTLRDEYYKLLVQYQALEGSIDRDRSPTPEDRRPTLH